MPRYRRKGDGPLDDLLRKLGQQIRAERKKQSMAQHQLAELSGIAQGNISAIENGRLDVQTGTLQRLAEAMGMTYHELLVAQVPSIEAIENA